MGKEGIVLNRMYVGKYIFENLGHEIINMYAADNGNHYLYLNATGNFEKKHKGNIGTMLLTKSYKQNIVEIIGKATGLKDVLGADQPLGRDYKNTKEDIRKDQKNYIKNDEGDIKYGGASILDIFNDAEQQSIFITYKADKFYKPKKRILIAFGKELTNEERQENADQLVITLNQLNWAKTSLKQYIYPNITAEDYQKIATIVNNIDLWVEDNTKVDCNAEIAKREISLIDICQIQNDENRFSYMLAYFMQQKQYWELWKEFFSVAVYHHPKDLQKTEPLNITLGDNYSVAREVSAKIDKNDNNECPHNGGRIDLLILDKEKKNIIVIENKIKSDINSISTDENNSTQLRRYYNYINWCIKSKKSYNGINSHYLILTPNYNIPVIEEEKDKNNNLLDTQMNEVYKIITYKELYDFLSIKKKVFEDDANFKAFYEAMQRHTYQNVNAYLYNEMEEKFIRRIKEITATKLSADSGTNY